MKNKEMWTNLSIECKLCEPRTEIPTRANALDVDDMRESAAWLHELMLAHIQKDHPEEAKK